MPLVPPGNVAVKVTLWPATDGLAGLPLRTAVAGPVNGPLVPVALIVTPAEPLLPAKLPSPP